MYSANFLISEDLSLTEVRETDAQDIVRHINDKDIADNTLQIPFPYYLKDAEEFISICRAFENQLGSVGNYAIRWQGEMVGGIGFLYTYGETSHIAEIGYWIGKEYRGRGIISQVIKKIIDIAWEEKGLIRLEANVFINNQASMKALEKAGFVREGVRKARFIKNGKLMDAVLFATVKS